MTTITATESFAHLFSQISPQFVKDPYAYYKKLRDDSPITLLRPGLWMVTGFNEVETILKDKRFGDNFWKNKIFRYGEKAKSELCFHLLSNMVFMKNASEHARLRQLSASSFSSKAINEWSSEIRQDAHAYIEKKISFGRMDLVNDFALPFCTSSIYKILGVPLVDFPMLLQNIQSLIRLFDPPVPLTRQELDKEINNLLFIENYLNDLITTRYAELNDGLIKTLTFMREENKISYPEWLSQLAMFFVTALDSIPYLICNAFVALFQHPTQLLALKNELSSQLALSENTSHELMRYDTAIQLINREALEDIIVHDVLFQKGEKIILSLGGANRDPTTFPNPDVLDLSRPKKRSLTFSSGVHACLGLHLASLQFTIALETLFQKLPNIAPFQLDNLEWKPSYIARGVKQLMVRW